MMEILEVLLLFSFSWSLFSACVFAQVLMSARQYHLHFVIASHGGIFNECQDEACILLRTKKHLGQCDSSYTVGHLTL